jgi:hypothetical protein
MTIEKAIAAALEPLLDDLLALERRVDKIQTVPGDKGDKGDRGDDADPATVAELLAEDNEFADRLRGHDGNDGAGIDAPAHEVGEVYRKGTVVAAHIGQYFRALKDTASTPGYSEHWQRVGAGGFRHRGAFDKEATYIDGDLFVKDFGTFAVVNGAPLLFAGRGPQGKHGDTVKGDKGDAGRDGSTIVAAQVSGFKLVLVQEHHDGAIDHLEADFAPAFRELLREAVAVAVPDLVAEVADLRAEVAALQRTPKRLHA